VALLLLPGLGVDPSWALAVRRPVLVDHAAGVGAQADLLMTEQAISAFSDWSNRPPLFRNRQAKALEMVSESSALMEAGLPHGPSLITQSIAEAPSLVSRLPGFGSEKPLTAIVDLAPVGLSVRVWDERKSDPFTAEEERIFAEGSRVVDLGTLGLRREDVVSVRHTVYDRSSGDIRIRAIIDDRQGRKHFVLIHGAAAATSGSGVEQLKALMPPFEELGEPGAALQVSMGNQGDLDGNFLLLPQADGSWRLYGATDQDWQGHSFRALIQWADGRRWLGFIRLRGEAGTILQVFFSIEGGAEQPLSPHDASFVLVANPLAWGSESGPKLLAESYTPRSDLRHIFNLPMMNGKLAFYAALAGSPTLLADAFQSFPVTLPLDPEMEPEGVKSALEAIGYHSVSRDFGLRYPGAFWLDGRRLHIVLRPAVYPLNALAVSADGAHLALVSVQGKSGRVGANYWTAGEDIRYEIESRAGWKPYAVFALDNGMDPVWRMLEGPTPSSFPSGFGRPVNAALLFFADESRWEQRARAATLNAFRLSGVEVGLHTVTAGQAYSELKDKPHELAALAEEAFHQGLTPGLDQIEAVNIVRRNPANDRKPVIFLLDKHLELAEEAAAAGANILDGIGWSPEQVRALREKYPHVVVISEIGHDSPTVEADLDAAITAGVDGVLLKKYADWNAKFPAGHPLSIASLRRAHPDLLMVVAGGIFDGTAVASIRSRPENVIAAVGTNKPRLPEFAAQIQPYVEAAARVRQESRPPAPGASRAAGWLFGTNDPVKIGKIEGYWQSFAGVWALQVAHAQGLGNVSDLLQAALPAFIGFVIALLLAHYITGVVVSEHEQARRWDPWLSFKATGTALIGFVGWPLMALGVVVGGPVGLVMILAGFAAGPVLHGWVNQSQPLIAYKEFLAAA